MTNPGKVTLAFRVGDLLLVENCGLEEMEVTDISKTALALKLGHSWHTAESITPRIKGKVGRVEYRRTLFGKKRVVVRT